MANSEWRIGNDNRAILLTGRRGVGKTTVCQAIAELARHRGYRPGGVITPALYACPEQSRRDGHGVKMGFEALDVGSGERWPLARTDRELGGLRVGPYSFDPAGLARALGVLRRAISAGCDLLMVDEIGPLELEQGEGFAPVLDLLPAEGPTHTLIVVRPALLDQLLRHLRISGSQKLAADCQIRRRTAGFGNPAGANCDLLRIQSLQVFSVTEKNRDELPLQIVEELWEND